MLDILRKKASSPITKTILFILALVFVLYFGWSSVRKGSGGAAPHEAAAVVNGEEISYQRLDFLVENQLKSFENLNDGKGPDEQLVGQLRQMALSSLIENTLLSQEAIKMGIRVSDDEVRTLILKSPQFQKNGKFDSNYYQNAFRPGFFNRAGVDYEDLLKQELLADHLQKMFDGLAVISDEAAYKQYESENTKIAAQVLALDPQKLGAKFTASQADIDTWVSQQKDAGSTDSDDDLKKNAEKELKRIEGAKLAEKLSKELWDSFKAGNITSTALTEHDLKLNDVPLTPLSQARAFFPGGGQANEEATKILAALSAEKPLPDQPIQVGQAYYFVRFKERQNASRADFEKDKETYKNKLEKSLAQRYYQEWIDHAMEQAKISTNDA